MIAYICDHLPAFFSFSALCDVGTFYNVSANKCQNCPKGHYSDMRGLLRCTPCGIRETTVTTASVNRSQCIGTFPLV